MELSTLKIFNKVVARGSFSSAANDLFMSPPAVLHRMNDLEKDLGTSLFNRNSHGVSLTDSGKVLYENAQGLLEHSEQVIQTVRKSALKDSFTIRIGSSIINPASELHDLWNKLSLQLPQYRLQFIPLENNHFEFPDTYNKMGQRVDLLFTPYGMESAKDRINFLQVGRYNFTIMMHANDPLANKTKIKLEDLNNQSVAMMPEKMTTEIDAIYQAIADKKLNIQTVPTDAHYTVETFNKFTASGRYLLSLDCWNNVLPGLVARPLAVPESLPYGFITAREPQQHVKLFMQVLESLIGK